MTVMKGGLGWCRLRCACVGQGIAGSRDRRISVAIKGKYIAEDKKSAGG